MTIVVVERSFPHADTEFGELESREVALGGCMSVRRVRPLASYFSLDRRHLVCLYESPDAESVRQLQAKVALPYELLWSATKIGGELLSDPTPLSAVMVARVIPETLRGQAFWERYDQAQGCLRSYRVQHACSFVSLDSSRAVCFYAAPDAEALRTINEKFGLPQERVCRVSVHRPG